MQVIDNFLPDEEFNKIKETVINKDFPLYFSDRVAEDNSHFYFIHTIKEGETLISRYVTLIFPLLAKLKVLSLFRAKVNCFPKSENLIKYNQHIDLHDSRIKNAVYYLNTCDGGTYFKNEFIPSVENRILLFNGPIKHGSTNCTDKKCRYNININYF